MLEADAERLSFVQGVSLSPDGRQVLFSMLSTDSDAARDGSQLWLLDVATSEAVPLDKVGSRNIAPSFSPQGGSIAFLSDIDDLMQIHVRDLGTGVTRAVTELPRGAAGPPIWSPDGSLLAFLAGPQQQRDAAAAYRVTRTVWKGDELGLVQDNLRDIYVVAPDGTGLRSVSAGERMHLSPAWTKDGQAIVANTAYDYDEHDGGSTRLISLPVDGGPPTYLTSGDGAITHHRTLPGGGVAYVEGFRSGELLGTRLDLIVQTAEGKTSCRTDGHPLGLGGGLQPDMPTGAGTGGSTFVVAEFQGRPWAYVAVQVGGTVEIQRVALEGDLEWHSVMSGPRSCIPYAADGERVLSLVSTMLTPWDLHICDPLGNDERRLTSINDDVLGSLALPDIHDLHFQGSDGCDVEGWVLTPSTGSAPHPAVLCIHGGPHTGYGHVFSIDAQLLVGAGYAVIMINQRGSTGYGDAFATAITGDWGNLDYHDLMAGVDAGVAAGLVDGERLAVTGISGGGNLSCWIVGQTDRFKAAIPENPVTDWRAMLGTSDVGAFMIWREMGGQLHEVPDRYLSCSPLTYAHRSTTPTLLIQAEQDYRCPSEQSELFYRALRASGCTVEMLRLPGVPHAGSVTGPVPIRRAQNEALLEWVKRWIGAGMTSVDPSA